MNIHITKNKVDWEVFVNRQNPIFYISLMSPNYGERQKEVTGFGLKYRLHHVINGQNTFYVSSKELQKAKKYYNSLIKNDFKKILELHESCKKYITRERNIIISFKKNINKNYLCKNYYEIIEDLSNIFLYLTVVPWMVLDGIDSTQNGNNKKIEELFLPLRATTRNILKATVLDKIWMIARDICNYKGNYMDFSFLTYEELGQCFRKENNIFKEEIKKRKHGCFFYHDNYDKKPVFVYDRNFLSQLGIKEEKIDVDIIKEIYGTVASVGLAKARVCIVNTKEDMQKCRGNFIVVSVSTKPFLTPVMKKAKAIITDEGGLSCHAAILSRELNVPCIIGTKIATKVLKDGDMVEVDANQGIVKKLK